MCLSSFAARKLDIPLDTINETKLVLPKGIQGQSMYDNERRPLDEEWIISKIDASGDAILQVRKWQEVSLLVYYIGGSVFAIIEVYSKMKEADTLGSFDATWKLPN